ncbi:MAG: sel1 repeat family protein [Candidatus Coatesbacteria bacterium]|nr:sel1 repeat family protein [Candidatus Coatesbacteria bacterium]
MKTEKAVLRALVILLMFLALACSTSKITPEKAHVIFEGAVDLYTGTCGCEDRMAAKELLLKASGAGSAHARMWIANLIRLGDCGFEKDVKKAKRMAKEAIDEIRFPAYSGDPESAYLMGTAYCRSLGVPKNYDKGLEWLVKAAEAGHAESMNLLACAHEHGWYGLKKDFERSFEWRLKAAEAGHAYAMEYVA